MTDQAPLDYLSYDGLLPPEIVAAFVPSRLAEIHKDPVRVVSCLLARPVEMDDFYAAMREHLAHKPIHPLCQVASTELIKVDVRHMRDSEDEIITRLNIETSRHGREAVAHDVLAAGAKGLMANAALSAHGFGVPRMDIEIMFTRGAADADLFLVHCDVRGLHSVLNTDTSTPIALNQTAWEERLRYIGSEPNDDIPHLEEWSMAATQLDPKAFVRTRPHSLTMLRGVEAGRPSTHALNTRFGRLNVRFGAING